MFSFLNAQTDELDLIRGQSGRCVFWDEKTKKFCPEAAVKGTESCPKHDGDEATKTGQAIRDMGSLNKGTTGFSIMKNVFRWNLEVAEVPKVYRYAPSLDGPLNAFKDSAKKFQKFLEACTAVYGDLKLQLPFNSSHFKDVFPKEHILDSQWKHAYQAMTVSDYVIKLFEHSFHGRFVNRKTY